MIKPKPFSKSIKQMAKEFEVNMKPILVRKGKHIGFLKKGA